MGNIYQVPWQVKRTAWLTCLRFPRNRSAIIHDNVIKWKHFLRYWPFVRGIHRSPVNSPHKGQWRGALVFSLICAWINAWVNNREAGDWRRHCTHYDVIVMISVRFSLFMCRLVLTWQLLHSAIQNNTDPQICWAIMFFPPENIDAARYGFKFVRSLWNLIGVSTVMLPRHLLNYISDNFAAAKLHEICGIPISCLVTMGPDNDQWWW